MSQPRFTRYIGIDYTGGETCVTGRDGLRVYVAEGSGEPQEVLPPERFLARKRKKFWCRKGVAHWLKECLAEDVPTIVGIDHAFSFPKPFFEKHDIELDWYTFIDSLSDEWQTDQDDVTVASKREGARDSGGELWLRLTEQKCPKPAKSVFMFGIPGQVAFGTRAGIPWLRFLHRQFDDRLHFWPYDSWGHAPAGKSMIVEVYPALWSKEFPIDDRSQDQHDAYATAAWLSKADREGFLEHNLTPELTEEEKQTAKVEGWILGVDGK